MTRKAPADKQTLVSSVRAAVPPLLAPLARPHRAALPAALYLILAAADLLCSLVAFSHGIVEGNPFMAWLVAMNWFIPGKIAASLAVTALIVVVYGYSPRWRWVAWAGVWVMVAVACLHLWAVPRLLFSGA